MINTQKLFFVMIRLSWHHYSRRNKEEDFPSECSPNFFFSVPSYLVKSNFAFNLGNNHQHNLHNTITWWQRTLSYRTQNTQLIITRKIVITHLTGRIFDSIEIYKVSVSKTMKYRKGGFDRSEIPIVWKCQQLLS